MITDYKCLAVGDNGPAVRDWQQVLQMARLLDDASGTYDADTAAATRAWQELHGLPATGDVGLEDWDAAGVRQPS